MRTASHAVEILGLQDRTLREVSGAGHGRRVLRVASSNLFAEHAAPGLIELFAGRAADLDVELSVRPVADFPALLASRTVDVMIGPCQRTALDTLVQLQFLLYEVLAVARPEHPLAGHPLTAEQARHQSWNLGPSAVEPDGAVPAVLHRLGVPEHRQRIFQSDAAATEETARGNGVALAVGFSVSGDGRRSTGAPGGPAPAGPGPVDGAGPPPDHQPPAAAELLRFITTPRATQAMVRGAGVHLGRFKPAVHVTLWS